MHHLVYTDSVSIPSHLTMQKRCPISSVVLAALCWALSSSSSSMFLSHQGIRYSTCGLTRAEGKDHLSQPAGNTPPHAAQDATQPSLLQGPIAELSLNLQVIQGNLSVQRNRESCKMFSDYIIFQLKQVFSSQFSLQYLSPTGYT